VAENGGTTQVEVGRAVVDADLQVCSEDRFWGIVVVDDEVTFGVLTNESPCVLCHEVLPVTDGAAGRRLVIATMGESAGQRRNRIGDGVGVGIVKTSAAVIGGAGDTVVANGSPAAVG